MENVYLGASLVTKVSQCATNASSISASVGGLALGSGNIIESITCDCNSAQSVVLGAPSASSARYTFLGTNNIQFSVSTTSREFNNRICLPGTVTLNVFYLTRIAPTTGTTGDQTTTTTSTSTTTTSAQSSTTTTRGTATATNPTSSSTGPVSTSTTTSGAVSISGPSTSGGARTSESTAGPVKSSPQGGLSSGAIAAAVIIPILVVLILVIVGVICLVRYRRKKSASDDKIRQAAQELDEKERRSSNP